MKKGIIFILVLMFTVSWAFAEKGAPIQYDPADYPAPTRQGGETVDDATVIGSLPYNDVGETTGFVDDYDETCPYGGSTSPDVVYSYTPTTDVINGFITLCGDTDYDSKLYIYENTVTPGAPFACNDDTCVSALGQSYVSELTDLTFIGGNTYYIVIDGYGGASGGYEIDVTGDSSVYGTIEGTVYLDGGTGAVEDVTVGAGGVTTNPAVDGTYSLEVMVGTYDVTAMLGGYESDLVEDVVVTENGITGGVDFTLTYVPATTDPPENLMVTNMGYATWEEPVGSEPAEFRYDDGVITAQLGFGANPSSVLGGAHPNNAVIDEVTWYLTSNAAHTEAIIYIFGLQPDGTPDTAQLLHESALLPNVDDAWNTYTLATPITASNGFFIGVCTPNIFTAIGTDDGVGAPWEFQLGTQWGIADWTAGNAWLDVGPAGFPFNFSIRAYGTDNGEIVLAPIDDSNINYANSGLVYSELNVPVNTNPGENRDFLGYNVYLDGAFVTFTTDLFYQYIGLVEGTTYLAEVTADYDEGESVAIDYTFTYGGGGTALTLPVEEGFEGGVLPDGWMNEYVVNATDWEFTYGVNATHPADPHTGSFNAYFNGSTGDITKLVTPQIDMGTATDVTLTFWHAQQVWAGDQDVLRVYYKDSAAGSWTLLGEYLNDTQVWTEVSLTLPNPSGDYYVAFEGEDGWGYGVGLDDISITGGGGTTLDPPINVMVDDETGTISWLAPLETIIEDDFDSFIPGDYIAVVGDNWTTWSNAPGGAEDALVTDAQASSPSNSVVVEENQDLVLIMDDYTTGKYSYDMKMYVPTGYCGYFNLQKTSTPGVEWAFQIYYQTDGTALGDAGAAAAFTHSFNHDEWMDLKVIVDLDNDWATYHFNGVEIWGYQYSTGCFGSTTLLQFGGVNIFGGANSTTTDTPLFYMDDVSLSELQDVTGFNVYLDGASVASVGDDVTEYMYTTLVEDETYMAGVSAVYAGGESDIVEIEFTYDPDTSFDPPSNPAAVVDDYNDVIVTWEAPSGAAEWMRWDFAVNNGAAIGLTNPGTFYVASHWNPADLADYDGAELTKIEFFPSEAETFIMHVWTGPNAGTLVSSEPVTTLEVETFQQVILSNPVTIDASQELWFGYEIIQAGTTHPAGTDDGPAVQELGDMISLDGTSWTGMSAAYGLDYNWNLAAFVQGADGETIVLSKPRKTVKAASRSLGTEPNPFSSITTRDSRSLAGYKIYESGVEIADITDPGLLTYTDESLNAGTYEYTIMAYYTNPDGESILTDPVYATVVLDCPTNFDAQFQAPNVIVTWSAPARGIDSYNVYRDGLLHEEGVTGLMFIDIGVPAGIYMYSATTVFEGGWESDPCDEVEVEVTSGDGILKPTVTELTGNYPNPFNPATTISFSLKEAGHVSINIYNMRGQLVKTLINAELDRNFHTLVWDGKDNSGKNTSSGVYFYKMKAQNYNSTKKMILMK